MYKACAVKDVGLIPYKPRLCVTRYRLVDLWIFTVHVSMVSKDQEVPVFYCFPRFVRFIHLYELDRRDNCYGVVQLSIVT